MVESVSKEVPEVPFCRLFSQLVTRVLVGTPNRDGWDGMIFEILNLVVEVFSN